MSARPRRPGNLPAALSAFAIALALPALARAQQTQGGASAPPGDVNAAAAAFEEGQRAQIARDYARAAELFEIAYRSAPSPAAIRSAIRNHRAAGHNARAATLALRARESYGTDAPTAQLADATVNELAPQLGRLRVRCSIPCSLAVDGQAATLQGPTTLYEGFVDVGAHQVNASWPDRPSVSRDVASVANQAVETVIEAPAATPAAEPASTNPPPSGDHEPGGSATVTPAPAGPIVLPPPPSSGGLSPVVAGIGAGLTVISAGVLIWSGVDTLNAANAYRQNPTEAGYNDGVGRETRTNVTIAVTGILGVTTLAVALFATNWHGAAESNHARRALPRPTLVLDGSRVGVGLLGSF